MTQTPLSLRAEAEQLAAPFPALLADAQRLAATVLVGDHGRRRTGVGDSFWQYRPAQPHDEARNIDWRRSARSDAQFVQEKEWQTAQSVQIWVDNAASMSFTSLKSGLSKAHRARTLAMAAAILLLRGGERVGLTGGTCRPNAATANCDNWRSCSAPILRRISARLMPHICFPIRKRFLSRTFSETSAPLRPRSPKLLPAASAALCCKFSIRLKRHFHSTDVRFSKA